MNTLGRIGRMGEAWGRGFRTRLKTVGRHLKRDYKQWGPVLWGAPQLAVTCPEVVKRHGMRTWISCDILGIANDTRLDGACLPSGMGSRMCTPQSP